MKAWVAEFGSAAALLRAAQAARRAGHAADCEAYSPLPDSRLGEALGLPADRLPLWMLLGGVLGGAGTYLLEWYSAVIDYPINVGGRPAASWPAFVPPAAEMTLLTAALFGFCAFLIGGGMPRLRHLVFEAAAAQRVSSDRFALLLREGRLDSAAAERFLRSLDPLSLQRVED